MLRICVELELVVGFIRAQSRKQEEGLGLEFRLV